jgi:hypothetical protein
MSYLQLLALSEQIYSRVLPYWEYIKQELRNWLGPVPRTYALLQDGGVVPGTFQLSMDIRSRAFVYSPSTKTILKLLNIEEGRKKPLPFIGIVHKSSTGETDISEWLGEIRAYPIPEFLTVRQILLLWSFVHETHLPLQDVTVGVVKDDGTEETVHL